MTIYFILFWILLLAAVLAAAAWGGTTERLVGTLYLVAALASTLLEAGRSVRWRGVEGGVLVVDLSLFAALAVIAVRSKRWWPACALSFQSFAVLAHVGRMTNPDLWRYGYQLMSTWSAMPTVLCLLWGTMARVRRRRTGVTWPGSSVGGTPPPRS